MNIIERLRECAQFDNVCIDRKKTDDLMTEAADMLEFFFDRMKSYDVTMSGAKYRFVSSGFPMNHCRGRTKEEAVKHAMAQLKFQDNLGAKHD